MNVPERPMPGIGEAFRIWLKIGLLSFGGPAGQIALMHRIVVDELRWVGEKRFLHALNFCTLLPGPEAQQLATYLGWLMHGVKGGLKAGLPKEYFIEGLDKGIKDRIDEAVKLLEKNGVDIIDISLPHTKYAVSVYYLIATAEASSNLARYDGVKYGFRQEGEIDDVIMMYEATRSQGFGKEVKRRIMLGTYVLSAGYYDAYYLKAQKIRRIIKNDFDNAFKHVDFIITPTTPDLPFKLGEKLSDPLQMYLEDIYTISLNLSGLPGLNVRCGDINGLPVGMQIIGKAFDEETVLRVGNGYEQIIKAQGAGRRAQGKDL